jgi:hypothetical protein
MSENDNKVYLGDSVYAAFDGDRITLTTENGFGATNTIVIEPEVYQALLTWVGVLRQRRKATQAPPTEG